MKRWKEWLNDGQTGGENSAAIAGRVRTWSPAMMMEEGHSTIQLFGTSDFTQPNHGTQILDGRQGRNR